MRLIGTTHHAIPYQAMLSAFKLKNYFYYVIASLKALATTESKIGIWLCEILLLPY
jgi:hypothetical protein